METTHLIVFDYSGTLSPEAPMFGRPDHLMKALNKSGLADLGIVSPHIFWNDIVNPTWTEGSTTAVGYKTLLSRKIKELFPERIGAIPDDEIFSSVSRFAESYFDHSPIDERWQPVLQELEGKPSTQVIIATDHYREATDTIVRFLGEVGIHAAKAAEVQEKPGHASFVVANSADLGYNKADRRFWETLKSNLRLGTVGNVLIIDDFGCNEDVGSSFRERRKITSRRNTTIRLLEEVFGAKVVAVPFMISDDRHTGKTYGRERMDKEIGELITKAWASIKEFLPPVST